jgi:uncharacterized protein YecE (DUF72 family)
MSGVRQRERYRIGCAGWAIPSPYAAQFAGPGTHLQRYARVLPAVEINSSFYRSHQPQTYARWAASVPERFQFAVKMPRTITHMARLSGAGVEAALKQFLDEVTALGAKLGPLLMQLPPSLAFDGVVAGRFFETLRNQFSGGVACEPRHPSWFEPSANALLVRHQVARVAADPAVVPAAAQPGGWTGLTYYRLHGSPRMYYSAYSTEFLETLAQKLAATTGPVWCIFDNTAAGAATANALHLAKLLCPHTVE